MLVTDTVLLLSGGAGNTDPLSSLGGAVSATAIPLPTLAAQPSVITGVVVDEVAGFNEGTATLYFKSGTDPNKMLAIAPPDGFYGPRVFLETDGQYVLRGFDGKGHGYMMVTVTLANMPSSTQYENLTIVAPPSDLFDDITPAEATSGVIHYRCVYLKNTHATDTITRAGVYVVKESTGEDTISVALDTDVGIGDGVSTGVATTLVDEQDSTALLSGLTFTTETDPDNAPLVVGAIGPGQTIPVWVKRQVPAYVNNEVQTNLFSVGLVLYTDA